MAQVFEIEINGETYEVEADTQEQAVRAAQRVAGPSPDVAARQAQQRSLPGRFARGVADVPQRMIESVKQLGTAVGEATGLAEPGATAEQVAEMNMRRLIATGGDPATEEAADLFEMVGFGAIPSSLAFRGAKALTSLPKAIGKTVGTVAGESALLLPASEAAKTPGEVFGERATAAALGAGISSVVFATGILKPAFHNYLVRLKDRAARNEETIRQRAAAGDWLTGKRGTLTVSQQTGNDVARSIEIQTKATDAQNFLNKQIQDQMNRWEALNRWVGRGSGARPGDVSFLTTARKLSDAWKAGEAATQAAASRAYGAELQQVLNLGRLDPVKFPVPFSNLANVTDEIAGNTGGRDWWRSVLPGAERATGPIADLDKYLKNIASESGFTQGLDVSEVVRLRRNLNQLDSDFYEAAKRSPNIDSDLLVRHNALRKVIRALDADIEAARQALPAKSPARDALDMYVGANKQYEQFKDMQDFMRQTATAQWFGGFQPADAQKFLVKVAGMEPAQQVVLVNTLQNAGEPGKQALHQLRMALVKQAIDNARSIPGRAASEGQVDLTKLGASLMGDAGPLGERIFTPAQFAEVKRGLAAIRVLEEVPGGTSVNRAPSIESTFMAGGSMSVPFLVRAFWRAFGTGHVERLLFSKVGLKSLDTLADYSRRTDPTGTIPKAARNQVARAMANIVNSGLVAGEMDPAIQEWIAANGGFEDGE